MKLWKVGLACVACVVGLLLGLVIFLDGDFSLCGGPNYSCAFPDALVVIGISLFLISLVALAFTLAYSFLRRQTTPSEAPN
ncbi:MAG: hypothetical protein ABSB29_03745 [Nitrososphaerales archaeon]